MNSGPNERSKARCFTSDGQNPGSEVLAGASHTSGKDPALF